MPEDRDEKMQRFFREGGKELESAMREAGSPLPEGLTGEMLVRETLEELAQIAKTPEARVMSAKIGEMVKRVAAELPGGVEDPQFEERMRAAMDAEFGKDQDGSGASA